MDVSNLNFVWAGLMVDEFVRNGVSCFCVAPGSRSSALTVCAANHPEAEMMVHFDERGLAFYAMGRTAASKKPTALICSSGTAAVNFFPAIVEASKKKLPLIVLTADRPPELRNTGALQTIDQVKLFGNYVRWFFDFPTPTEDIEPEMVLTTIDQAVFTAKFPMPGPVHINCMFREPLAPINTGFNAQNYLKPIDSFLKNRSVFTTYTPDNYSTAPDSDESISSVVNAAKRGVLVVGKLRSDAEAQAVLKLAAKLDWPIFPDIVSGLRLADAIDCKSGDYQPGHVIHYFDQVLLSQCLPEMFPIDTVLHLGGRITAKRWYQFIKKQAPKHYVTVLNHHLRNDPLHMVTHRVKSTVEDFCNRLLPKVKKTGANDHLLFMQKASQLVHKMVDDYCAESEDLTEIKTARAVSRLINKSHGLFLSNSMPVREFDMYAAPNVSPRFIGANRGASGIDGIIATACGMAAQSKSRTSLVIGDLAFLHDLNSLVLVKRLNVPMVLVVINNDGGGIFSFLPIAQSEAVQEIFQPYFGTPHGLECSGAAAMFGLKYQKPANAAQFEEMYAHALTDNQSTLIEVVTQRDENYNLHRQLQQNIAIALDKMLK